MSQPLERNATVLANCVELGAEIIMAVAGEDVANTIDGKAVPTAALKASLAASIQNTLTKERGVEQ